MSPRPPAFAAGVVVFVVGLVLFLAGILMVTRRHPAAVPVMGGGIALVALCGWVSSRGRRADRP